MDTLLLAYERATNMTEIADWANRLRGKEAPGAPGLRVVRVVRFQILDKGEYYTALILVEVSNLSSENQVALKEADMVEIEQITSGIEDALSNQAPSSGQEM
jgi:hypothetical protein